MIYLTRNAVCPVGQFPNTKAALGSILISLYCLTSNKVDDPSQSDVLASLLFFIL